MYMIFLALIIIALIMAGYALGTAILLTLFWLVLVPFISIVGLIALVIVIALTHDKYVKWRDTRKVMQDKVIKKED